MNGAIKFIIAVVVLIIVAWDASADCVFNGKSYAPLESTTMMEPSYYQLSEDMKASYADGAALVIVCTPVLNVVHLDGNNWSKRDLTVTHDVWVAAEGNFLYGNVNLHYPDKIVKHVGM